MHKRKKNCIFVILYAVFGGTNMKIIWNEKEKKRNKKRSKQNKRHWLLMWRMINWWKLRFPELIKEALEAIGE